MSPAATLALVPRDGFFCKDGRGWYAGGSGRSRGVEWPWPSTVVGAVRTGWGRRLEAHEGRVFAARDWRERTAEISLGSSLALRRPRAEAWNANHVVWPAPEDAAWRTGAAPERLEPRPPPAPTLGRDDDAAREALWTAAAANAAKPLAAPRWWTNAAFVAWLTGKRGTACDLQPRLTRRVQAHVSIDARLGTAEEGMIYSHDVIETIETGHEWAIGIEAYGLTQGPPDWVTLGSDRRLARVEPLPASAFAPPQALLQAFAAGARGIRLFAATPLCFENGWLPDGFTASGSEYWGQLPGVEAGVRLRAAMVTRPQAISGWDMEAGRAKPTTRAVAPGAVYFFDRADGGSFGENEAAALWLGAFGGRTAEGFGRVVAGVWHQQGGGE